MTAKFRKSEDEDFKKKNFDEEEEFEEEEEIDEDEHTEEDDVDEDDSDADDDESDSDDEEDDEDEDDDEEDDDDEPNPRKEKTYRGKLNATNRFLEKEGYEFVNGKWQKKDTSKKEDQPRSKKSKEEKSTLTPKDLYVLMKNDIDEEDIPDVEDYARARKITIKEALKSPVLKGILSEKKEIRETAAATHRGSSKRGSTKLTDEKLLSDAKKGILPESEEDIERLWELRKKGKSNKKR